MENAALNGDPTREEGEQTSLVASQAPKNGLAMEKPTTAESNAASQEDSLGLPLSAADGLIKKPFARPLDSVKIPPPPTLTPEQEIKYASLLKTVSGCTEVPTKLEKSAPKAPITEGEKMFMTRECLLRYLRATKWNVAEAETRLLATHTWRREYGVEEHTADYISIENETGKQMILGYDIHGRPCLYMLPSRQNTKRTDRQIQHLVFMLERVVDLMLPGQETLTLLINFKDTIPFFISGFFKIITPFIDPLTREKLKFNEETKLHVPTEQLVKEQGGQVDFEYDHSVYWPALVKMAELRRKAFRTRWEQGGKQIGEYEGYLRGGAQKSLADIEATEISDKVNEMKV